AQENVAEGDRSGLEPAGVVESTGGHGADVGHGFHGEAEIAAAGGAEMLVEPAAGFIREVAIAAQAGAGEGHVGVPEHGLGAEGRTGPALAPGAAAQADALGIAPGHRAHGTANTAAFMSIGHGSPSRVGSGWLVAMPAPP